MSLSRFLQIVPVENFTDNYSKEITDTSYFGFPIEPILRAEERLLDKTSRSIGYFSMEYGLSTNSYNVFTSTYPVPEENISGDHHVFSNMRAIDYYLAVRTHHRLDLPIYSGGLGVLAGDSLKSAADRAVPLVAVGILWNKGYFKQNFWFKDGQIPEENNWDPKHFPGLVPLTSRVEIKLRAETIRLRLWKYFVYSHDQKSVIPLILLDSDIPENSEFARKLTGQLYKSDNVEWKMLQRIVLGMGGMAALNSLDYGLDTFHLNEGHAAMAFVQKARKMNDAEISQLKKHFAYTCHTPVAAGHDRFPRKMLQAALRDEDYSLLSEYGKDDHYPDLINLTEFSMNTCAHVNAVAEKHGEITRLQFPHFKDKIQSITNGVHSHTWVSSSIGDLLSKYPETQSWRHNPMCLTGITALKDNMAFRQDLWQAHQANKKRLCSILHHWKMSPDVFTICWARRIASYKRPSLILQDIQKLLALAEKVGPIQIIFAGKAHPKDDIAFTYVNEMLATVDSLEKNTGLLRVLMLENYDTYFGKLLSSSVDVWLNNPLPPFEASGTSGMKAILNGVLQVSTLDGWVVEAADKNVGWIFGWEHHSDEVGDERNLRLEEDSTLLYQTLEQVISLYYQTNAKGVPNYSSDWITKMTHAIAAGGFFNTDRMVKEYSEKIWGI